MSKYFIKLISFFILITFIFSTLFFLKPKTFSKSFEQTPIFVDSFENKLNTEDTLSSQFYKEKINSTNKISFKEEKKGMGVYLDSLFSFIGYSSKYINPEEGTIRFYYKPDENVYEFYNTRQPEWKDFGSYKPPFAGYLIDTVGYLSAFSGAFSSSISFSGDKNNKNIIMFFSTWSGSNWSYAKYETKNDFVLSSNSFYDIALTWSKKEGKIKIFIDGVLKGSSNYVASLNNNEIFFIGHNPFQNYWPYGPHSLIGTYDELKIYDVALSSFSDETPPSPPSGSCDLFSDDFERTSIGVNWIIVDDESSSKSNWHITSDSLIQDSNIYRTNREYEYFQGTHIITGNSNWSDYTFSFEVTPTDDDGVGAVFRYQDKNNYYRFIMVRDSSNKGPFRRIDKIVNGEPFQVLSIDNKNSFEINKKYKISVKVYGSSIKVFMDGVEILRAEDSTYKSGKIGFMTYASDASFDNLCVSTQNLVPSQNPNKPPRGLRAYPGNNKVYLEWDQPEDTKNLLGYYIYRAKGI
ncbi:MAG: LamG-like jellyroll fold domain-containing protein [Caldisericia bacterium]